MQIKNIALFAGAAAAATSICDKYTTALLKNNTGANQYTLLTLLVNTAFIGNFTGPGTKNSMLPGSMNAVPGIVATGQMALGQPVNLLQYFDGSLDSTNNNGVAGTMNFLDGGGATPILADPTSSGTVGSNQYILLTHLYEFFGLLLGCSQVGMTGFPAYAGDPSMYNVHKFMDLNEAEMYYFIDQVGLAASSFGASSADVTTVAMALNSTFGYRCAPPAKVAPGSAQLQAICINSDCPEATASATCGAYAAATEPATAVSGATSMASMAATGAASSAVATAPVSQISDGQPQATSPGAPLYTNAAAAFAPGAMLGLAGLAVAAL